MSTQALAVIVIAYRQKGFYSVIATLPATGPLAPFSMENETF
uniref:Uncharacterized protein n=1 Tax=Myoviridae sp. ctGBP5 TaxID=2825071 RepID=A0A8S5PAR7_9CAUD|nr:MAG TPA: hypothetical protein [Myoviridae sp. ctGBP5]